MYSHATFSVTVIDGQANVEIKEEEKSKLEMNVEGSQFQVVGEGESLTIQVQLGDLKINVDHPDLDLLMESGIVDKKKLKVIVSAPRLDFTLEKRKVV